MYFFFDGGGIFEQAYSEDRASEFIVFLKGDEAADFKNFEGCVHDSIAGLICYILTKLLIGICVGCLEDVLEGVENLLANFP